MKTGIRHIFAFLVILLAADYSFSQAPDNIQDYLREKFLSYLKKVPWEEIYIHTDREEYISGESLWFKIYLVDRKTLSPSSHSRIAYFEILNEANKPVIQKRVLLSRGFGPGQIYLPDTLSTGVYTLRGYTNWMKNFLPDNCFRKEIRIYNSLGDKRLAIRHGIATSTHKSLNNPYNRVDVKTEMKLSVRNLPTDDMEIVVSSCSKSADENMNKIFLCIQTHGILDRISAEPMREDSVKIIVPWKSLTPGINQVTIFNSNGQPVLEKYTYSPGRIDNTMKLQSAGRFGQREKVEFVIDSASASLQNEDPTGMSISVSPASPVNCPDMVDYMIFGTEFGLSSAEIFKPGSDTESEKALIDSMLPYIKSKWIDWNRILNSAPLNFKYPAETENHFLSGKLLPENNEAASSSRLVIMNIPGKEAEFQYARTDSEGNFTFQVHIDEMLKDLVLQPDDTINHYRIVIKSTYSDSYDQMPSNRTFVSTPSYIEDMGVNYQVRRIYGITDTGNPLYPGEKPEKPIRFYGKPDLELIMDEYVTLPEMQEVFVELLPHASLKKINSTYRIEITDRIADSRRELTPAIFLDGVKLRDATLIAKLDPSKVEKIDIIKEEYRVGRYSFRGIANFITKSGDFSAVPMPDYMVRIPYQVIDPVRTFISPDYSSKAGKESPIPDFRNTLYWDPVVKPGKNGKIIVQFWTSDVASAYIIKLQGFNSDGRMISVMKSIRID